MSLGVDERSRACVRACAGGRAAAAQCAGPAPPRAVEKIGACSGCRAHSDSTGGHACSVKASGLRAWEIDHLIYSTTSLLPRQLKAMQESLFIVGTRTPPSSSAHLTIPLLLLFLIIIITKKKKENGPRGGTCCLKPACTTCRGLYLICAGLVLDVASCCSFEIPAGRLRSLPSFLFFFPFFFKNKRHQFEYFYWLSTKTLTPGQEKGGVCLCVRACVCLIRPSSLPELVVLYGQSSVAE
jgi:hypothetical protein